MSWFKPKSVLDKIFEISILAKGIDSAFEIIGGVLLALIRPATLNAFLIILTQHELSEDPNDFIANRILYLTQNIGTTKLFGAFYLLSHGLVKIVLIIALLRNKLWAYPSMIVLLLLFILYQLYRFNLNHSLGLALLTIFDLFIVWLTWREYQKQKIVKSLS